MTAENLTYKKGKRWEALIPALALLAPFFNLLVSDNYSPLTPEALIVLGLITMFGLAVGLLILKAGRIFSAFLVALFVIMFIDFQLYWYWAYHYIQHVFINLTLVVGLTWLILRFRKVAGQSLLAGFVVINISTLAGFLMISGNPGEQQESASVAMPSKEGKSELPILVHVLLDEFGGVRGLENSGTIAHSEIVEMTTEYLANGFSIYPNGFSQFFKSTLSIGHTFNLRQQFGQDILTEIMKSKYFDLSDNAYFSYLRDQGFQLHVYSNEYLNFCNEGKFENVECNKYKYKDLSVLRKFPLSTKDRAVIIGNVYLSFVNYFIWVKELTRLAWNLGEDPSRANIEEDIIGFKPVDFHFPFALGAIAEFNQLKASLETARPGDAYFIHMLLPHYPYVVDSTCQSLPISQWIMLRFSGNAYQGNSRATQDLRYTHYWQQVKCANKLMGELLTRLKTLGLDKNTVLIIHGDHGSRITMIDPLFSEMEKLEARDYLDSFSTFMAVKLPGVQGQIYSESITLVELLSGLTAKNFKALPDLAPLAESPSEVYLGGLISTEYFRVPYPEEPEN